MMRIFKRYRLLIGIGLFFIVAFFVNRSFAQKAMDLSVETLLQMAYILPPIFLLLGLLDVWVPKETMVKFMGEGSGIKGMVLAIIIGSAAAGPLYGAFPVAAVFMKKGVKFTNILIFIGAWSTTKIPMFLFEMTSLGTKFALTRLFVDIPGIIIMAYLLAKLIPKHEIEELYKRAADE